MTTNLKQGVTRAEGCRMSVVEAVWNPEDVHDLED